ncbi:hypothetical protein NUM_07040 [Actinocatenispora comari]|uniref:DUF58 domain-containing protein n=1 Tax=Actinocatenispora comari TaxID=2807577 RepID=A0A8J4ELC2_9ACTN|nr:hypothetical protein NUM_07040 [Actinocatenispora comari]
MRPGRAGGGAAESPAGVRAGSAVQLRWSRSPRAYTLGLLAAASLVAGYLTGRGALAAFAAGPLVLLAFAVHNRLPAGLPVDARWPSRRCLEGDTVTLTVRIRLPAGATLLAPALSASGPVRARVHDTTDGLAFDVTPHRWGELRCAITLTVADRLGVRTGRCSVPAPELVVLPRPPRLRRAPRSAYSIPRLGEHPSLVAGSGTEFLGLREYQPGEALREINRAASARGRGLYLTERAAERASDIVVGVDAFAELGPPGRSTVDRSVRGAVAVARAAARSRDRVGLIVLAGIPRWLRPEAGIRQLDRLVAAVLEVRRWPLSEVTPDLRRVPRTMLPPRSVVVLFSPLTDGRARHTAVDLSRRGARVIVVDVLDETTVPARPDRTLGDLAHRLWRLERGAQRAELAAAGIRVVRWPDGELSAALAALSARGTR